MIASKIEFEYPPVKISSDYKPDRNINWIL